MLVYGETGEKLMKKKIKYSNAPKEVADAIEKSVRIKDFLPPPEKLVAKDDSVRITINLNKKSVSFFKQKAKKQKVPYQRMIKSVIDHYVSEFS